MSQNPIHPRPTMTDIAKLANVSQSTVSLVINDMSGAKVSNKTRELVLRIARELGYPLSRRPRVGDRTERNLILYLTDELSTSPHAVQTIDGAKDLAWENDCLLAVFVTRSNVEIESAILNRMLGSPALLGVIYATIFTRAVVTPVQLEDVPTVLLNCHNKERGLSSVVPAELLGGFAATMHLIEEGHKRIGFINGEPWMEAASERLKGYRQALSSSDIPFNPQLVRNGDWMARTGYDQTISLMALQDPPSAIFCANDLMAMGALDAARELNLDVPQQISIIGYDDQEIASYTHPPLTSVMLPNYEMGRWAVETLIEQTRDSVAERAINKRISIKMECPLVVRESVASI